MKKSEGEKSEVLLLGVTLSLLSNILSELDKGKHVMVLATDTEVTTQQAADFLNFSRPYPVKLLEEGRILYRLVGPRRRILLGDLLPIRSRKRLNGTVAWMSLSPNLRSSVCIDAISGSGFMRPLFRTAARFSYEIGGQTLSAKMDRCNS